MKGQYFQFVIDVTNRSTPLADNHISELSFRQEVIRRTDTAADPTPFICRPLPLAPLAPLAAPPTPVVRSAAAVTQSEAVYSVAQILHGKVFLD